VSPEQLLRDLEGEGRIVIGDLEAGVGTLLRMQPGQADVVLVVAQPTAKAIEVARRAIEIAAQRGEVLLLANRVTGEADVRLIREGSGWDGELVALPDDPAVAAADEDGVSPVDHAPDAPVVRVLGELAARLRRAAVARFAEPS
jgi:CO dehydrogenase nickel-insertion accessory protein CooC1